jgi:arylsulfatase A-like enzyme/Flp pilus assembly protein TadD
VLFLAACGDDSPATLEGWNVLLITLDTARADRIGCYGRETAETPHLDALAASGVRFDNAVAQVPVTLPSHASILTGTFPIYHGARNNANYPLPEDNETLAESFREAGYATTAILASRVLYRGFRLDQGFDHYDDEIPEEEANPTGKYRRGDAVTLRALAEIRRLRDRPFFAWVHYYDPHAPYLPPEPYRSRHASPYDGEIAYTDACVGELLQGVDRLGLRDRTLVVVTADHGEGLGDPHDEDTHGILLYEETLRIPLLVAAPGRIPAGRVVPELVRSIDIAPTILELTRLPIPAPMQGISFVPSLVEGKPPVDAPSYFDTLMPKEAYGWSAMKGWRDRRWKYVEAPRPELFDLIEDPREQRNLATELPGKMQEMAKGLARIEREFGREFAASPHRGEIDPEILANLEALGYVVRTEKAAEPAGSPKDPKDYIEVQNYLNLSDTLVEAGRGEEALEALVRALEVDPENLEVLRRIGVTRLERGELDEALRMFERMTELAPSDFMAQFRLGQSHRDLAKKREAAGDAEGAERARAEAVTAYTAALSLHPEHALSLLDLANILARQGKTEKAVEMYRKAYTSLPSLLEPHFNRAVLLHRLGRSGEAILELEWIIENKPKKEWEPLGVAEMLEQIRAETREE